MSKKDAWMPLDVGDYLRDTAHLTTIEHGAYFLLLMYGWVRGGALPVEDERLRSITKMDGQQWKRSRSALLEFFRRDGDAYRQKRLDAELAKTDNLIGQRVAAGRASAEARNRQRTLNGSSTSVERALNERSNEMPTEPPTEPPTNCQRDANENGNETADLYKEYQGTKKEAKHLAEIPKPRASAHDPLVPLR